MLLYTHGCWSKSTGIVPKKGPMNERMKNMKYFVWFVCLAALMGFLFWQLFKNGTPEEQRALVNGLRALGHESR